MNERGAVSPAHRAVHTEVSRHPRSQLELQTKSHVEPPSQVTLELAPTRSAQCAAFVHRKLALAPVVTWQSAMSQLELVLSPVVIEQLAPIEQATLHDIAHVPMQREPAPQFTCWLPPLGIVHAYPTAQVSVPAELTVHPGPGQIEAVKPPSPPPSL